FCVRAKARNDGARGIGCARPAVRGAVARQTCRLDLLERASRRELVIRDAARVRCAELLAMFQLVHRNQAVLKQVLERVARGRPGSLAACPCALALALKAEMVAQTSSSSAHSNRCVKMTGSAAISRRRIGFARSKSRPVCFSAASPRRARAISR